MNLAGKTAVVTGGSRGIGRAICLRLAQMGAGVVINYVSRPDAAEETRAKVEALGGKRSLFQFDVADGSFKILLEKLKLRLPAQAPPKICGDRVTAGQAPL